MITVTTYPIYRDEIPSWLPWLVDALEYHGEVEQTDHETANEHGAGLVVAVSHDQQLEPVLKSVRHWAVTLDKHSPTVIEVQDRRGRLVAQLVSSSHGSVQFAKDRSWRPGEVPGVERVGSI